MKKYVHRYDGHGLVLKTDANSDQEGGEEEQGQDLVAKMAKSATNKAMK